MHAAVASPGAEMMEGNFRFTPEPAAEVVCIPTTPEDVFIRKQAERFIQNVGLTALDEHVQMNLVEHEPRANESTSLMDSIHRAARGEQAALSLVYANASTDVIERTIKAGHVMSPVVLQSDGGGRLLQHGQPLESIDANAHRYASESWQMKERAAAETRNRFRIESAHRQGLLKDYAVFVPSRAADNMSAKQMENAGFFADTMSVALQVTTENDNGEVTVESAFVAGVSEPGAPRHDAQSIVDLGRRLGVDYSGMSATEILDSPLLIHKSLMPNGVIDLVKLYDDSAGGTFFGQDKPRQDYLDYQKFCRERERQFEPVVQNIVEQLVAEVDSINTPLDAVKRLHKLSQQKTLRHAIETDTAIDARVFGDEAASLIEQARIHYERGNYEMSMAAEKKAQRVAKSSSCPSEVKDKNTKDYGDNLGPEDDTENSKNKGEDEYGSLTFKCPKGHKNTRPRHKLIPKCKKCGVSVAC